MNPVTTAGTALADASAGERHNAEFAATLSTTSAIGQAAARVRSAERCTADRVAAALGHTVKRWRERDFAPRRETIAGLSSALGMSAALLDESLDALLEPVTATSLEALAVKLPVANRLFGFLMPGNVPGAGIHEVCAALLAGAGLIVKSASGEPLFFASFMRTLAEFDVAVGARAAVVNFGRGEDATMRELWACCDGGVVAYGDDATIAALAAAAATCDSRRLAGFGSRLSGALVVAAASPSAASAAADGLARDVTLFEQRGCLSPHHVFVIGDAGQARGFAARLARALERLERRLPSPTRLPLDAAAAIRTLRERARWRALTQRPDGGSGAHDVALWEGGRVAVASGASPGGTATQSATQTVTESMKWTVIYDGDARFCASPAYRTVFVSALENAERLGERLGVAAGRLEAFALAASPDIFARLEAALRMLGVSYVCEPGRMQSPPLDWPHGGGAMLELLREAAR